MEDLNIRCQFCDRFLKIEAKGTVVAEVVCPDRKCKQVNQIKVINGQSSHADMTYKFSEVVK